MMHLTASVRVYLCTVPCDMRRSFDGLHALVTRTMQLDAFGGHVGGGEKGYQFGGREGARCGVTLWPPVGRRKRKEADCFPSQAGLSSLLTSGVR